MAITEEYLTREEVCDLLRISRTTLWRLNREGQLLPTKIGRRSIYSRSSIDAFMAQGQVTAESEDALH